MRSTPTRCTCSESYRFIRKIRLGDLGRFLDRRLVALQGKRLVAGIDQRFEDARTSREVFAAERAELDVVDLALIGRELAQQRLALFGDRERNPPPVDAVLG